MLSGLPEIQHRVLKMYFGVGGEEAMSLESISNKLGLTKERIRQIKDKVLIKLRSNSGIGALKEYLCQ